MIKTMIIDGKLIAKTIEAHVKQRVSQLPGRKPSLAVILVGDHPASHIYVGRKQAACQRVGILSQKWIYPDTIKEQELLEALASLNHNPEVDGILVQLPLPPHIDPQMIANGIDPSKDVDGLHPINAGKLLLGQKGALFPCTPLGIMALLKECNVPIRGKNAVIIGRSAIVGKPTGLLLLQHDATVTFVHSKTENVTLHTKNADILIAACGIPHFVTKSMVKPGACVIDVGINRLDGKLVGDVDFENVQHVAGWITPVPGGVGPMTIAMLLENTLKSYHNR
jgi:methylenetetrahydrofolate dehydrogenase (NADP+)/methenyltetrahydrofolate cyclohydrolase